MKYATIFLTFLLCGIISANVFSQNLPANEIKSSFRSVAGLSELPEKGEDGFSDGGSDLPTHQNTLTNYNLPFFEDWSSGSFSTNSWTFDPSAGNWFIASSTVLGNPAPGAVFSWDPIVTYYSFSLISPQIDISDLSGQLTLAFDYFYDEWTPTQTEFLKVYLDNSVGWMLIDSFQNYGDVPWTTKSYFLDEFLNGSSVRIKFEASGQSSNNIDRWIIDNIKVFDSIVDTYPQIELSTYSISALPMNWNDTRTEHFTIYNTGQADLLWETEIEYLNTNVIYEVNQYLNRNAAFYSDLTWLSLSPSSGNIPAGESQIIAAVFDPGDVSNEYWHQANILINSNDPLNPSVIVSAEMCIGCTNVAEQSMEQIFVGPIPSSGILQVKLVNEFSEVQLISSTGQQIFVQDISGQSDLIMDLNNYDAGTYVLKFINKRGDIALRKIVLF
jgi:hypothetical protein